jgi:hypothetical protein
MDMSYSGSNPLRPARLVPRSNILKHQPYRESIAHPHAAKIAETGLAGKDLPGESRERAGLFLR